VDEGKGDASIWLDVKAIVAFQSKRMGISDRFIVVSGGRRLTRLMVRLMISSSGSVAPRGRLGGRRQYTRKGNTETHAGTKCWVKDSLISCFVFILSLPCPQHPSPIELSSSMDENES
jgi:hypothetical protein